MSAAHIYRKKVEFSETDMAGIAHFSNFFRWMEAAEVELFEKLGYPLITRSGGQTEGWPRVRVHCEFHAPLHFRDELEAHLHVKAVKPRAVVYAFRFYRIGGDAPHHAATGEMTTVFARHHQETREFESANMPSGLMAALEALAGQ